MIGNRLAEVIGKALSQADEGVDVRLMPNPIITAPKPSASVDSSPSPRASIALRLSVLLLLAVLGHAASTLPVVEPRGGWLALGAVAGLTLILWLVRVRRITIRPLAPLVALCVGVVTAAARGIGFGEPFLITSVALGVAFAAWFSGLTADESPGASTLLAIGLTIVATFVAHRWGWIGRFPFAADSVTTALNLLVCWGGAYVAVLDTEAVDATDWANNEEMRWRAATGMMLAFVWVWLELVRFQYLSRSPRH